MFELVKSGGWLMLPIILCSIVSISIIAERFWSLRRERVLPKHLVAKAWHAVKQDHMTHTDIEAIGKESSLGAILSADETSQPNSCATLLTISTFARSEGDALEI